MFKYLGMTVPYKAQQTFGKLLENPKDNSERIEKYEISKLNFKE